MKETARQHILYIEMSYNVSIITGLLSRRRIPYKFECCVYAQERIYLFSGGISRRVYTECL